MATVTVIPTEAIVSVLLQVFAVISSAFLVVQVSLLLLRKLLNEWRETRDHLRNLRAPQNPASQNENSPP